MRKREGGRERGRERERGGAWNITNPLCFKSSVILSKLLDCKKRLFSTKEAFLAKKNRIEKESKMNFKYLVFLGNVELTLFFFSSYISKSQFKLFFTFQFMKKVKLKYLTFFVLFYFGILCICTLINFDQLFPIFIK